MGQLGLSIAATFSHQLQAIGGCGARALLHGPTPGMFWSWVSSSTVAFLFLPPFASLFECPFAPHSHSHCMSLSLTQFLSLCASHLPIPFWSVSLTFSFSQSFLGYLCVPVILSLTLVSLYFLRFCLSLPISFSLLHLSCLVLPNTPTPKSRSDLAGGARPGPSSGHPQVQKPPYWEPEGL